MSPAPPQKELFARPTPTPSTVFVNDRVCVQTEEEQDALFLGPPGTGKSHLAQAVGKAVIDQGYRVIYREAISCSKKSQKQPSMETAKSTWNCWPPCPC
ncbi:MAG: hypothetical protein DMG36_20240 [Acidobacteria bacterium]|nr:MAG: hypothetical protein DMG36_20240 [Acidobacteriota bacterium]